METKKIYFLIISLPEANERRENIRKQFEKNNLREGIDYSFFKADTGDDALKNIYLKIWKTKTQKTTQLSTGQLGCFSSHIKCWGKCIEENRSVIILEDDVCFCDNFLEGIFKIYNSNFKYVRLMSYERYRKHRPLCDGFVIYYRTTAGTAAYYLTPQGALDFLSNIDFSIPIDKYMDYYWLHGVANVMIYPQICKLSEISNNSQIGYKPLQQSQKSILTRITRTIIRTFRKIRAYMFVLKMKITKTFPYYL